MALNTPFTDVYKRQGVDNQVRILHGGIETGSIVLVGRQAVGEMCIRDRVMDGAEDGIPGVCVDQMADRILGSTRGCSITADLELSLIHILQERVGKNDGNACKAYGFQHLHRSEAAPESSELPEPDQPDGQTMGCSPENHYRHGNDVRYLPALQLF